MRIVMIVTDGACAGNPGPGAWGAVLRSGDLEKRLSGFSSDTTNNKMEITAAYFALRALKGPCEVDLYSDSKYLVETMNGHWRRRKNLPHWESLDQVAEPHHVRWHWRPRTDPMIEEAHGLADAVLKEKGDDT